MIPVCDVTPTVPSRTPECALPSSEEMSEEGFGYFRDTWFIGRVLVRDGEATVHGEAAMIEWLNGVASCSEDFELLASAIEGQDASALPDALRGMALQSGLREFVPEDPDFETLSGLEIGVSGLSHALSAVGCRTAASCRSHAGRNSWSDCPVVFFAAPTWRVEILGAVILSERCGLAADRGMLKIYGASVRDTNRLARRILEERARFRRMPDRLRRRRRAAAPRYTQLDLPLDDEPG